MLENRLRRVAQQQGFRLIKSHKGRHWSLTQEMWQVVDFRGGTVIVTNWPQEAHPDLNFPMSVPQSDEEWGFGIVRADYSGRPAYAALLGMPKP